MKTLRILLLLSLGLAAGLVGVDDCYGQTVGKEGNRAVGVVFHDDGTPFAAGQAMVGILHMEDATKDYTNADGVFCVVVPKNVRVFQLVYWAPGYYGQTTPNPIKSTGDPIKVEKVSLRQKKPDNRRQLEMIDVLMEKELTIYKGVSSAALKKAIREDLIKFSESIKIPARDPSSGITEQERQIRINARLKIDETVFQMR